MNIYVNDTSPKPKLNLIGDVSYRPTKKCGHFPISDSRLHPFAATQLDLQGGPRMPGGKMKGSGGDFPKNTFPTRKKC